jgi:ArsR family transcriptional regulator
MDLIQIYECFCDRTRLRILHLLTKGPLCVCHFQEVLKEPQVKVSKHLGYLRTRGLVTTQRSGNWIIYSLPEKRAPELETNLRCLQDCAQSDAVFTRDLTRLDKLHLLFAKSLPSSRITATASGCTMRGSSPALCASKYSLQRALTKPSGIRLGAVVDTMEGTLDLRCS